MMGTRTMIEKNVIITKIFVCFAAVLSTIAIFADVKSRGNISLALNGAGIPQLLVLIALAVLYCRIWVKAEGFGYQESREKTVYWITSIIFAACMIIGKAQEAHPDLKYGIFAVILLGGYVPLFYVMVSAAGYAVDSAVAKGAEASTVSRVTRWFFEDHVTLGVMLVVFICRLPYLIAFYPCSMSWDGGAQIVDFYEFMAGNTFSNHHPPLVSFLYGSVAYFSDVMGIPNLGMFMIPIAQTCLTAFATAKVCGLFKT